MTPRVKGRSDAEPAERAADPIAARKKAMDYLARREYGHTELGEKLIGAGFEASAASAAVAQLARDGLQDDRRFADSFIQSRVNQGKGPVRIRQELGQRGVDESLLNAVLDDRDDDWAALARSTRQRKFGSGPPADFREKARQMRFLQYRGFTGDQIRSALGETD